MIKFSRLFKGSIVVTFGTIIGGALSYLFSALMGRMLGPSIFGDLGAIMALMAILTSAGAGLTTVTMFYAARLLANKNYASLLKLQRRFTLVFLLGSSLLSLILILNTPFIVRVFSIQNTTALILGIISLVFSYLIVVNRGILQGVQRFTALSWSSILELAIKVGLAVVLVRLGYGLLGAIGAVTISLGLAYLISFFFINDLLRKGKTEKEAAKNITRKDVFSYTVPTLLSTVVLLFATNVDILIIKRFFDPVDSGQYVAVSSVAKIIFYFVGPIASVMFPMITELQAKGEKHYQTLFYALLFTAFLGIVAESIFYFFPEFVIGLLYGAEFIPQAHLLPAVAWFVLLLSMVNLMAQYYLSIRQFFYVIFFLPASLIIIGYGYFVQPTEIMDVVRLLQFTMAGLFAVMSAYYLYLKRSQIFGLLTRTDEPA